MNDLLVTLGLEGLKPALGALLLPPAPLLLMALIGCALIRHRPRWGWGLALTGLIGVWLGSTLAVGNALIDGLTRPPPSLDVAAVAKLKGAPKTAIVILGGGGRNLSPEYDGPDLTPLGQERLRYGLWLAKQTQLPVLFSGGIAHGARPVATEAQTAQRIALRDYGLPIRWAETTSRDTNENARHSLAMLRAEGMTRIVLVTHGFHMQRSAAAFARAVQRSGAAMDVVLAPMGFRSGPADALMAWLPSAEGFTRTQWALHEWLGRLAGA